MLEPRGWRVCSERCSSFFRAEHHSHFFFLVYASSFLPLFSYLTQHIEKDTTYTPWLPFAFNSREATEATHTYTYIIVVSRRSVSISLVRLKNRWTRRNLCAACISCFVPKENERYRSLSSVTTESPGTFQRGRIKKS